MAMQSNRQPISHRKIHFRKHYSRQIIASGNSAIYSRSFALKSTVPLNALQSPMPRQEASVSAGTVRSDTCAVKYRQHKRTETFQLNGPLMHNDNLTSISSSISSALSATIRPDEIDEEITDEIVDEYIRNIPFLNRSQRRFSSRNVSGDKMLSCNRTYTHDGAV